MFDALREWTSYARGILLIATVGIGVPVLLLDRLAHVITGLPTGPLF